MEELGGRRYIEVRVVPTAEGTDVTVEATLALGGADRGGSSWVRVVPNCFGAWCARRDVAPRPQPKLARLAVELYLSLIHILNTTMPAMREVMRSPRTKPVTDRLTSCLLYTSRCV